MAPFLRLQSQQSSIFKFLSDSSTFLSTFKTGCDYAGPTQVTQDNVPVLKHLISSLIPPAALMPLCQVAWPIHKF